MRRASVITSATHRLHAVCMSTLLLLAACAPSANETSERESAAQEAAAPVGSSATPSEGACEISTTEGDFIKRIGCKADFDRLASIPIDANIPGARSVKVVLDQLDGDALYFQNSQKYQIHYQFASKFLSGNGKPV